MTRHPFRLKFWIDIVERIEPFHFAGDPTLEGTRVEVRDGAHPAAARYERIPKCFKPYAIRREDAHAGDNDSILLSHGLGYRWNLKAKAGILAITLNPVIMFFALSASTLFTKFRTYSQVASCLSLKNFQALDDGVCGEGQLAIHFLHGTALAFSHAP
jgi:hypothetical protein